MDDYCNFCGTTTQYLLASHDGKALCLQCARTNHLCEICGSLRAAGETEDTQKHYDEDCFK